MGFFTGDDDTNYERTFNQADQSQAGYNRLGTELGGDLAGLRRRANGEGLQSTEMLRHGLQQNLAGQRSMAAGASPQNNTIAALTASRNAMNLGSGMAGQAAQAGLAESAQAQESLIRAMLERQRMEQQAAQFNRQMSIGNKPQSWLDQYGGAVTGGVKTLVGM